MGEVLIGAAAVALLAVVFNRRTGEMLGAAALIEKQGELLSQQHTIIESLQQRLAEKETK